jgi:nucleoside-diphosphate-sugar epimerase
MATIFATGASGYIGSSFIRNAVGAGHQVYGLTRSESSAQRLQQMGATPVIGDLAAAGSWQEALAGSEMIVHLAQPDTYGARITLKRARAYETHRLQMDTLLLNALNRERVRRVVFVCGTSYYGDQGKELRAEDATPNPKGWGPYVAPAIEALKGFVAQGFPIVEAYPGWVYGPASWFAEYQLEPLAKGWPVIGLAGPARIVSPVHVEDCARALLHLLEHGAIGQRYFVVDDVAVLSVQMVRVAAQALGVPPRTLSLPKMLSLLALGPIVTESLTCDFRLSNQRLKATGFSFEFPSIETGIPDVVRRWRAGRKR